MQGDEVTNTYQRWKPHFQTRKFYLTAVPTYAGGVMAMGFASKNEVEEPSLAKLKNRSELLEHLRYYTPQVHLGSFGLPKYVWDLLID